MIVCLMAFIAGALLAFWVPVAQFALGLVVTAMGAVALAIAGGGSAGPVARWAVLLYIAAQAGYAAGVMAMAFIRARRARVVGPRPALTSVGEPSLK